MCSSDKLWSGIIFYHQGKKYVTKFLRKTVKDGKVTVEMEAKEIQ